MAVRGDLVHRERQYFWDAGDDWCQCTALTVKVASNWTRQWGIGVQEEHDQLILIGQLLRWFSGALFRFVVHRAAVGGVAWGLWGCGGRRMRDCAWCACVEGWEWGG
jgi:hypothetical protein